MVYLGVPLEEFSRPRSNDEVAAARAALGIPPGTIAIGTVTRLMPSKGNEYLIQAMKPVVERLPNARCYIVGEGELQARARGAAARSGVRDKVELVGFRSDVAEALSAFDLVVFPSLWEGTPLTALEALAMGKPIVSTDADGLQDVLTQRRRRRDRAAPAAAGARATRSSRWPATTRSASGWRPARGRPARATTSIGS